jgi:glucose-6-phosphate dehydrogenase assembly protein OpcA
MEQSLSLGMPVEIGSIDRELKKLWEQGEGALTRASLVTFAIYCHGQEAMVRNTDLISKLMQDHACRAILIGVEPDAAATEVQAWIDAHCHITREGAKQVCCEQISFLLQGDAGGLIPNIVFSHLDSDLPLYLWWQGDFTGADDTSDKQLWSWVDRLFFDSLEFGNPHEQFRLVKASIIPAAPRLVLCDLNWVRSLCLRQTIAQIFESPANLAQLKSIKRVSLSYAPGYRTTAALVVGWMITQLNWKLENICKDVISFDCLGLELHEREGAPIGECSLSSEDASFSLKREKDSAFWHADIRLPDGCEYHHLFAAGKDDALSLLDEELMLGGKHLVYLNALAAAESLLIG